MSAQIVTEFVLIEDGKETDWVDPVIEFEDKPDCWRVWNGYASYLFEKRHGTTYAIRVKEARPWSPIPEGE